MARVPTLSIRHQISTPDGKPTRFFVDFMARFVGASEAGTIATADAPTFTAYPTQEASGGAHRPVNTSYATASAERVATDYSPPPQASRVSTTY